jgi:hypothetical protein
MNAISRFANPLTSLAFLGPLSSSSLNGHALCVHWSLNTDSRLAYYVIVEHILTNNRTQLIPHRVVEQNLSSALIIEDDVDWDIRIRPQLHDFALSARTLTQPLLSQPNTYADPTYLDPSARKSDEIPFFDLPLTMPPAVSPYGDNWDILWLGHCAMRAPNTLTPENASKSAQVPKGLVVHSHDPTVPQTQHLHNFFGDSSYSLVATYPNHTRIIHHFMGGWCSLAYAVTQTGARKLLYELGVTRISDTFDNMLREVCQGTDGRGKLMCLTVQPPLFEHYRAEGSTGKMSDITDHGDEVIERGYTENIRLSTRVNLAKLINGETDYVDQWEDAP